MVVSQPPRWPLMVLALAGLCMGGDAAVEQQAVVWTDLLPEPGFDTSQANATTYHNTMPIGNGHVAANVNYESANDTLAVLISASSSWSEDGILLKVALLEVSLPSRGGAALQPGGRHRSHHHSGRWHCPGPYRAGVR